MKKLLLILYNLDESDRNVIIENLDYRTTNILLNEVKGRAEGPWKSLFKQSGIGLLSSTPAIVIPILGMGISVPLGTLSQILLDVNIKNRINSAYYQCKTIKNQEKRLGCQKDFLEFLIKTTKEAINKTDNDKLKKRLNKSVVRYETAKSKVLSKMREIKSKSDKNKKLSESASFVKIFFPISLDFFSPVVGSRIDRMWHYCNERKGVDRYSCLIKTVEEMKRILKKGASEMDDKNSKSYKRVMDRIGRLDELKEKYTNKLRDINKKD
jgi:hypothetical protein